MAKQSAYLSVSPPLSGNSKADIKQRLGSLAGVLSVAVGDASDTVSVDYDASGISAAQIEESLRSFCSGTHLEKVEEY